MSATQRVQLCLYGIGSDTSLALALRGHGYEVRSVCGLAELHAALEESWERPAILVADLGAVLGGETANPAADREFADLFLHARSLRETALAGAGTPHRLGNLGLVLQLPSPPAGFLAELVLAREVRVTARQFARLMVRAWQARNAPPDTHGLTREAGGFIFDRTSPAASLAVSEEVAARLAIARRPRAVRWLLRLVSEPAIACPPVMGAPVADVPLPLRDPVLQLLLDLRLRSPRKAEFIRRWQTLPPDETGALATLEQFLEGYFSLRDAPPGSPAFPGAMTTDNPFYREARLQLKWIIQQLKEQCRPAEVVPSPPDADPATQGLVTPAVETPGGDVGRSRSTECGGAG